MTAFFQGLVLGVVQGITEWLLISSEGINTLILLHFFQKPLAEAIRISIWLHTGTVLAALIYFRKDVVALLRHLPQYVRELATSGETERNTITTFLIVSTVLTGVIGAPFMIFGLSQKALPAGLVMAIIGVFLIITGVVQAFSVFPGLSRS